MATAIARRHTAGASPMVSFNVCTVDMDLQKNSGRGFEMLTIYKQKNSDIPEPLRSQMAIFHLAPVIKKKALNELYGHEFSRTPFYHRSWYWWQTFRFSNLGSKWPEFCKGRNNGEHMSKWIRALSSEQKKLLARRHGQYKPPFRPTDRWMQSGAEVARTVWTKGGVYSRATPIDQILITGTMTKERPRDTPSTRKLTKAKCRTLEKELQYFVDVDTINAVEARWEAVSYARRRLQELLGWQKRGVSLYTTSWFFQEPVPDASGYFWWYPERGIRIPRKSKERWTQWVWW